LRGIDTNLLVRFVTRDDPDQAAVVRDLFQQAEERRERLHVSAIVLCELAWTLRGQPYLFDRATIAEVLERIMETSLFEVQNRDLALRAVADYGQGRADFADYLIGWQNRSAGCEDTLTFDRKLRNSPGFTVLSASES
jgi:predicted nucleic-acid-binding protein